MSRPIPLHRWPATLLLAGAAFGTLGAPQAAHAAGPTDEIAHIVQPGDTLEGLAQSYFAAPQLWPRLQARNKVKDPKHLQPGSVVWIPVQLQPAETARVEFVHGQVTAQAASDGKVTPDPAPLTTGATLAEGTKLDVGPDAFVTVRLADGSIVRVSAQSQVQLQQLRRRGRTGSVQSVLEVQRGSVESTVPPSGDASRRFEVRTPRAVTSVRGTRFGVALTEGGQTTAAVLQGAVAVQSRPAATTATAAAAATTAGSTAPRAQPDAVLHPGQGVAVQADGTVGRARELLPAPDLSTLPQALHEPGLLALDIPAQPATSSYQVLIARDADMTQVLRSGTFAQGQVRWPALEDGAYFISVRPLDDAGIPGMPAVQPLTIKTQPVPPLYQQPAAAGVVSSVGGQLLCTQVPGARWYRIQVAADAAFTQPVVDESRLDTCKLSLATLAVGHYFWRAASVRELAQGQADQGPFAAAQPFTLAQQPPALSSQSMQASDGGTTVSLHWQAQAGQRFRLQLAHDLTFEKPAFNTLLNEPHWTAADLPAGSYFVRIQVLDPSGLQSDFSPPRSIRVGTGFSTSSGLPVSDSSGEPVRRP